MVVRGPPARRNFHVDPSDEILYMLRGAMRLGYLEDGGGASRSSTRGSCACCRVPPLGPATGAIGSSTG